MQISTPSFESSCLTTNFWLSLDAIRISYSRYVCTPPWGCLRWPVTPRESTGPLLYWKSLVAGVTHTHTDRDHMHTSFLKGWLHSWTA